MAQSSNGEHGGGSKSAVAEAVNPAGAALAASAFAAASGGSASKNKPKMAPKGSDGEAKPRKSGWSVTLALLAAIAAVLYLMPWDEVMGSFESYAPPQPTGPYETRIADVEIPGGLGRPGRAEFLKLPARLFYPLATPDVADQAARGGWPLIVYMPGWQGKAVDNDSLLLNLASYGYVIVALDDIVHDEGPMVEDERRQSARRGDLDYSSDEGFSDTLDLLELRVEMSADKIIRAIDGLVVVSHPDAGQDFPVVLDMERVAVLGFSFGGASGVAAMERDPRIGVAINMDGYLVGPPAQRQIRGPYLEFNASDPPFVVPGWLSWLRPRNKYAVLEEQIGRSAAKMQLDREDAHLVLIWGARHTDFTADLHSDQRWRGWRPWLPPMIKAEKVRTIVDAYVLAFLQTYLLGQPHALITGEEKPFDDVRSRW